MIGNIEFEVFGEKRGFRFGTYAIKIIGESSGIKDINEIFKRIQSQDIDMLLKFYFGCAAHYAHSMHQVVNFNEANVSDWLDELGLDKVNEMSMQLLEMYKPKKQ